MNLWVLILILVLPLAWGGEDKDIILATTTSVQDSGLLDALLPEFERASGYRVKVIAVGTGQALALGRRGEADLLLIHSPAAEEEFMREGFGLKRRTFMHNDFIIVGPKDDPAQIKGIGSALEALRRIAKKEAIFISRGDDSGTHRIERELWKKAGIIPKGSWYLETGQGMGETLYIANQKFAYTLSDRATYLSQKNLRLVVLVEGEESLLNFYSIIEVNPASFPRVNHKGAKALSDFLVSEKG